jgi:hypothetical protein
MSTQGNIPIRARVIQLFGYETGGSESPLWTNPGYYAPERDRGGLVTWMHRKRSFTHDEIRDSRWIRYNRN